MKPGIFLARQLEQKLPQVYLKRYPDLWGVNGEIIPSVGNLDVGADTVVAEFVDSYGEATFMSDEADDVAVVDVSVGEDKYKVFSPVTSFKYTVQELNAAIKAQRDLTTMRQMAAKRAIDEKAHRFAVYGSSKHGVTGLLNDANVPLVDSSFDADNINTSEADLIDFFADNLDKVFSDTQQVESVDTIIVTSKLRNQLVKKHIPGSGESVLSYLLTNYGVATGGSLRRIVAHNEVKPEFLQQNGVRADATKERIMFLPSNPDAISRQFSLMQMMPPQLHGTKYKVYAYQAVSPTMIHYPGSCLYVDIPAVA